MVMSAAETASAPDQATLDALRESVASVLEEQCGSTDLHAFIDGKSTLDKTLWGQAGSLGWLGIGIPEQSRRPRHGGAGPGHSARGTGAAGRAGAI